jgi:Fic/DOC family
MRSELAGFSALNEIFDIKSVQPLTSTCLIRKTRSTVERDGFRVETFTPNYAPNGSIKSHFEFGLKYDDLNFEWLSRFFEKSGQDWIVEWIRSQPASIYARKTAFFYEWFKSSLPADLQTTATNYETAIDPKRYLVASNPIKNKRWRIEDNMPGTQSFCPLIRINSKLKEAVDFDLARDLDELDEKFGSDLLMRSASWLTFNESRASFLIEKEQDRKDDIRRFASAMMMYCGRINEPLSNDSLVAFQKEVLGQRSLRTGIRKSPVFVGSSARHDVTLVHYIAPASEQLDKLMEGLRSFEEKTREYKSSSPLSKSAHSVIRTSAIAFAFVYIHPFADGNGRVHRLLVNDTLIRDGVVPQGVILPVSSTIVKSSSRRGGYQSVLDSLSRRLMRQYNTSYKFDKEVVCEDGVITDFQFDEYKDAIAFWRHTDLTNHCAYMADVIRATVRENMTDEAQFLALHDEAKKRLKTVFEMPDNDADSIVRSLRENKYLVTNSLRNKYFAIFNDEETSKEIIEAVSSALEQRQQAASNDSFDAAHYERPR